MPSCWSYSPSLSQDLWLLFVLVQNRQVLYFGPFIFVSVDSLTPLSLPYSAVTWDSHIYYRCPLLLLVNYYCVCLFGWQLLVNLELKIP